ncbi:MAG: hypothetical protein KKA43_07255, partial [Nanoarchaeota archaeon]|nr:hypothetical protein [Nanoarchaeota archaeon]
PIIIKNYKNLVEDLNEKLDNIELEINQNINDFARTLPPSTIQFKEIRQNHEENILLLIHEILHVLFTVKVVKKFKKKLAEEEKKYIDDNFLQYLLDSFIDTQIFIFTNFDHSIWKNLKKSTYPPYFTDEDLSISFNEFIHKNSLSSKLINLDELIGDFISINYNKIKKNHCYEIQRT